MASYMGCVDVFRAIVPRPDAIVPYPVFPENNFIDGHVIRKLKKLNIAPSGDCAAIPIICGAYILDVIGTLPTADEAKRFFADKRTNKRELLVEELLARPEFADYWALKWADLLRVDREILGHKRAYAYYRWIRESIAANKAVRSICPRVGDGGGPAGRNRWSGEFLQGRYQAGRDREHDFASALLGVRIACAECHHHPYDRWSQTDYFGMQAFFTPVSLRPSARGESIQVQGEPVTKHPRTGEAIQPYAYWRRRCRRRRPAGDRRTVLAEWMTAPSNPFFARNLANRMWKRTSWDAAWSSRSTTCATPIRRRIPELLDSLGEKRR